jgi:hypothetical protein
MNEPIAEFIHERRLPACLPAFQSQLLADEHVEALVRHCNRGEVAQLCLALRLHEPKWLGVVRRALEDTGHDAQSLEDRFRAVQGGAEGNVSRDAFAQVLEECGVAFD